MNSRTPRIHLKGGRLRLYALKKASAGKTISEEEQNNLIKLSQTATILADNLNQLLSDISSNGTSIGRIEALGSTAAKIGSDATSNILKDSFTVMEEEFPETPTLIYDGPFSTHIEGMTPKLLEGREEITAEEALKRAAAFFGTKAASSSRAESAGAVSRLYFFANDDGGTISFEVTKEAASFPTFSIRAREIKRYHSEGRRQNRSAFPPGKGL